VESLDSRNISLYNFEDPIKGKKMIAIKISLMVLLGIVSMLLILMILLHKGRGGGLSDMFGGGVSTTMQSSGVAERNLNRISVILGLVWVVIIVTLALFTKFNLA
jgi:preprotein translocase subunit SecG